MQRWLAYAVVAAVALAVADSSVKLAAGRLSDALALMTLGGCILLTGVGWLLVSRWQGVRVFAEARGIAAAVAVGIAFSVVNSALYLTFGAGAPVSRASPLIRLGGLLMASVVGIVLYHEPLTVRYALGLLMACSGVWLMAMR